MSTNISLDMFYNSNTLNIFSDASVVSCNDGSYTSCYGVVAVVRDSIIDSCYKIAGDSTNNDGEIKGIRAALSLANKYKFKYKTINIFSDSQISIFGLKNYMYNWKVFDGVLMSSSGKPVANQNIFVECYNMLLYLANQGVYVNFFHQSGHVGNNYNALKEASSVFSRSNKIFAKIDLNLIRYIATYNNYVDQTSRDYLKKYKDKYTLYDPIYFTTDSQLKRF